MYFYSRSWQKPGRAPARPQGSSCRAVCQEAGSPPCTWLSWCPEQSGMEREWFCRTSRGITKCSCRSYRICAGNDPRHRNFWHSPCSRFSETSEQSALCFPGVWWLQARGQTSRPCLLSSYPICLGPEKKFYTELTFAFLIIYLN